MKISDQLQILSQIINFVIFIYFAIILIETNPLDFVKIIISAVGLIISVLVSIISVLEKIRGE
jgi:hypothetical protein